MNDNRPLPKTDDVIYVDAEEWDRIMAEMLNPRRPTQKMIEAAKLHKRLCAEREGS